MLTHVFILAFVALSRAMQANRTLNNDDITILYLPNHAWSSCDIPSSSCHRSIPNLNAALQLSFRGTALYLYSIPQPLFLNLSFSLDGLPLSPYAQIQTDPLVFSQTALPNSLHTLRVDVDPGSTFFFDHLVYTVESTPVLRVQPRQATATDNSTATSTSIPNQSSQEQIGAIAGAIAASVGITSLFSLGLAISIIKIRRQRLRVRRQREAELERTQGLSLHLPPSSTAYASPRVPLTRYTQPPPDPTAVLDPPPMYDSVMRRSNLNSTVLAHLPPIEEVSTIRSSQASRLSRRDPSSIDEIPDNPPGLSTVADHPSVETIRASQDASRPSEHHHQS